MRQVLVVLHATLILFQARVQKKDLSDQLLDRIAFGDTPGYIKRTQREKEESQLSLRNTVGDLNFCSF